jgi:ABC-2 type transport system permease protein
MPGAVIAPPTIAPISDMTYRNYDGPIQPHAVRWWVVSLATIRANINRNRLGFWIPAVLILLTYLIFGAIFYFSQSFRSAVAAQGMDVGAAPINQYATALYSVQTSGFVTLLLFIATLVIGSSSIAADNRANALLVYLSKPLTRIDYLIGKWMGIFLLLFGLIAIPSLLLFLFFATVYYSDGFLKDNPTLIFRLLLGSAILPVFHTSLILGFSAWSKSARVTGAIYAAFYLVMGLLTILVGVIMHDASRGTPSKQQYGTVVTYSSVAGVANGLSQHIYGVDPQAIAQSILSGRRNHKHHGRPKATPTPSDPTAPDATTDPTTDASTAPADTTPPDSLPPLWALLPLGALYTALPLAAAYAKVRAVEVVKG